MGKPAKRAFDAQDFLAKVGEGKSILQFKKSQNVFVQGDPADTVFYTQKGRIRLTVLSDHGKEAVVGIVGRRAAVRRNVRCWANNGKHMLALRVSAFDPNRA
jgi:hypothetical protein